MKIAVTPTIAIDDRDIRERFVHSGGPGGQHVNKVATAVQLRFDVAGNRSLPPEVRRRLTVLAANRISGDGVLTIDARRFRSREQNRRDALERLTALIRKAAAGRKDRVPTRPSASAARKRLAAKRQRSLLKRARRHPRPED